MKALLLKLIFAFLILASAMALLVLSLPIGLYLKPFERTQSAVQLIYASGSLKSGSGIISVVPVSDSASPIIVPGVFSWRLALERFFVGEIALEVSHTEALARPVRIALTPSGIQVSAVLLRVPLGILQGLGAPFNSLRLAGFANLSLDPLEMVTVGLPRLSSGLNIIRGKGRLLVAIQRQSTEGIITDVGNYSGKCKDFSALPIVCTVNTLEGPLVIDGTISLQNNLLKYHFAVGNGNPKASEQHDWLSAVAGTYTSSQRLFFSVNNK